MLGSRAFQSLVFTQFLKVPALTLTVSLTESTSAASSASPLKYSCLHESPTFGSTVIITPGFAPLTPASQDPALLTTLPSSYSAVSSPKYHTFPSLSCAYQSFVSSASSLSIKTLSLTTTTFTPRISFASFVTVTSCLTGSPSST